MENRKFIKVKTDDGYHVVPVDNISYVSSLDYDSKFLSKIVLKDCDISLNCYDSQTDIYRKLLEA